MKIRGDEDNNFKGISEYMAINKLNTHKFYTIVVTHWHFLHLLGACAPNNLKPVTIFYGLIPDNAIKSPSLVKHATEKNNPYCIIWHLYVCTVLFWVKLNNKYTTSNYKFTPA